MCVHWMLVLCSNNSLPCGIRQFQSILYTYENRKSKESFLVSGPVVNNRIRWQNPIVLRKCLPQDIYFIICLNWHLLKSKEICCVRLYRIANMFGFSNNNVQTRHEKFVFTSILNRLLMTKDLRSLRNSHKYRKVWDEIPNLRIEIVE